ncbi:collagen alpha-1(XII) chain-like isoform X5 [Saccostrea cucullata]|uniref:collagen alpha-1(XII) chain-like isoform X5 n=1 Tax=Saccostrea cuccullata TaxID=36930 RepID=UPI002ED2E134
MMNSAFSAQISWILVVLLLSPVLVISQDQPFLPRSRDECEVVDLIFILDRSWSLRSPENFQKELSFVADVVSVLDFSKSRVSVITFSDDADLNIQFNEYRTLSSFQNAIRTLPWVGGNTYTHKAIEMMLSEYNSHIQTRAGITTIGVIITDGGSTDPYKLEDVVKVVHNDRIEMYAIGVGDEVNRQELEMLATGYDHVFLLNDLNSLSTIQDKLVGRFCRGTPAPTQAPPSDLCESDPADIFFIVDKSSSLQSQENFNKELTFIARIIDSIIVGTGRDDSRVGLISFSTNASLSFGLSAYTTNDAVKSAVLREKFTTGDTYTHKAFNIMLEQFRNTARRDPRVKKIGFIVTDGQSTDPNTLKQYIEQVKSTDIEMYAVGCCEKSGAGDFDSEELNMMASKPSNVFHVDDLDDLRTISVELNLKRCRDQK